MPKQKKKKFEILEQKGNKFLWKGKDLINWDVEVERRMMKELAGKCFWDILIVGYEMGLIQKYLSENSKVKKIVTIEKEKEIVEECQENFGKVYGEVFIGNFFKDDFGIKFDCVVSDVCKEIMLESLSNYRRFKKRAEKLLKPHGMILGYGKNYFEYLIDDKAKKPKFKVENKEGEKINVEEEF